MKKLISLSAICLAVLFSGCIATNSNNEVVGLKGIITGATYKPIILERIYEVTKIGVVTFMTEEQIQRFHLDTVDTVVRYAYSITKEGKLIKEEVEDLATPLETIK